MKKGRRLVLDETNLRILEIASKYPEGIYFPKLLDEFSGKKTSGPERAKIKNIVYGRVRRLEKYGYLITKKHQGLLWVKLNPIEIDDFDVKNEREKSLNYNGNGKKHNSKFVPKKNRRHHITLCEILVALFLSLRYYGVRFISDVEIKIVDGKRVITGLIGLKDRKIPFVVRVYGFNRSLSLSRLKRDISLFLKFPNHLKIVVSTSYIERKALRLLKKLGVKGIFTLNYNIHNYGDPRRFKSRWNFRKRFYPELPKNPPIIIGKGKFLGLMKSLRIRAIQNLISFLYLILRKTSRLARDLEEIMYRLKSKLYRVLREGDHRAEYRVRREMDKVKERFKCGLSPPNYIC